MDGRIETLVAAGILHRLEDDAAHAGTLQREIDDRPAFLGR